MLSESCKSEVSEVLPQMTESPKSLWRVQEASVKDIDCINILQEEYLIKCSLVLSKRTGRINNMCHKAIWPRSTTLYSEMGEKIDREIFICILAQLILLSQLQPSVVQGLRSVNTSLKAMVLHQSFLFFATFSLYIFIYLFLLVLVFYLLSIILF